MNRMDNKYVNFVDKLKFQSSDDETTWNDEYTADGDLKEGWNKFEPTNALKKRYYRFFAENKQA
jgi:hypothetical protein